MGEPLDVCEAVNASDGAPGQESNLNLRSSPEFLPLEEARALKDLRRCTRRPWRQDL